VHILDWIIVLIFLISLLLLGFRLAKRAGSSAEEFINAGRKMPWWLGGTSMIAVTINASTMLQDTRKVREDGMAGMWFNWQSLMQLTIASVWFFRLYRRAGYTTQMEFYESRYTGWKSQFARLFDTAFYGIGVGAAWASIGLVGMKKVVTVMLGLPEHLIFFGHAIPAEIPVILLLVTIALTYSAASGVHGVVWTDLIEAFIALFCSTVLALIVISKVGWNSGLSDNLQSLGERGSELMSLVPSLGLVLIYYFLIHPILTQGGYVPHVQRFLALKDEKEVIYMSLYANIVSYVIKPVPYWICGLASIFLITDQEILANLGSIVSTTGALIPDYERIYPALIKEYLPIGLTGLMIAGFLSAFMSSFDSNIHNATCVFTHDFYRAFLAKKKTEKHYVNVARGFMVFQAMLASIIGIMVDDILALMMIGLALPIAPGLVKLARFFWWRVNGWAEFVAQIASLIIVGFLFTSTGNNTVIALMKSIGLDGNDGFFVTRQLMLLSFATVFSIVAILVTKPEPMEHLVKFYKRMRPYGWWGPVIAEAGESYRNRESIPMLILLTIGIVGAPLALTFMAIGLMFANWTLLLISAAVSAFMLWMTFHATRKLYPKDSILGG
jgi:solute:Na+ symporter, SSS family